MDKIAAELIKMARSLEATNEKLTRTTFLYLEPKNPEKDNKEFAQCATCVLWTGEKTETCFIHGPKQKVDDDDSCEFYVEGKPQPDFAGKEMTLVTPDQSGLVGMKVRCENCMSFDGKGTCQLYEALNKAMPEHFDCDAAVLSKACCNAFRAKGK